jgi:hypothetical protein
MGGAVIVATQLFRALDLTQAFARQTKTFPTEAEAKQFAKEMLSNKYKVVAGRPRRSTSPWFPAPTRWIRPTITSSAPTPTW